MHRAALDSSLRLLLNACAAAALLVAPGCAKRAGGDDGSDDWSDDWSETPSEAGCGSGWPASDTEAVELEISGTIVSLTRHGDQVIALLREGALVPVAGIGPAITEELPAGQLRAWAELDNGDRLAVGEGGTILRSPSGTFEWAAVDAGLSDDLLDVVAVDDGALAIASSRVLWSSDGGQTWTELSPGTWSGLRRAFRADGQTWLIGDGGQVWTSVDPLGEWEAEKLGTSDDLLDGTASLGCSNCAVIISAHTLYRRDPAGWTAVPAPTGEVFTALASDYVSTKIAVYSHGGDIYGADSLERASELEFEPIAVAANSDDVFVAGSTGEVVRLVPTFDGSCFGRPWMIDGRPATADVVGCEVADRWARDGLFEHASVASFAQFIVELLALAAPPELIQAAQAAILDEIEHARLCFELAAREHGGCVRAGPLPLASRSSARAGDPVALALAVFAEGCIGEGVAVIEASLAASECEDAEERRVLERIVADERRHAALAWRTLRWLVDEFGAPVREALRAQLAALDCSGDELRVRTIAAVVRPLGHALLEQTASEVRC